MHILWHVIHIMKRKAFHMPGQESDHGPGFKWSVGMYEWEDAIWRS